MRSVAYTTGYSYRRWKRGLDVQLLKATIGTEGLEQMQAAATDNGLVISLSEQHAFPLEIIFEFLKPETVEPVLTRHAAPPVNSTC